MMEHSELVKRLTKDPAQILGHLDHEDVQLIHMVLGISGEAGEILDTIKKRVIYNQPLDRDNLIEELGDMEFFLQGLRATLDITREETLAHNIAKLSRRY